MYTCSTCSRNFSIRIQYLIHLTKCGKSQASTYVDYEDCESSEIDDTDEDPDWEAEEAEAAIVSSPCSSPVTNEQRSVAKFAEDNILELPNEVWSKCVKDNQEIFGYINKSSTIVVEVSSPIRNICVETGSPALKNDDCGSKTDITETCVEQQNTNSKKSVNRQLFDEVTKHIEESIKETDFPALQNYESGSKTDITETCVEQQNTKSKKSVNRQLFDEVTKHIEESIKETDFPALQNYESGSKTDITETCVEHQNTKSKKSVNRQLFDEVTKHIEESIKETDFPALQNYESGSKSDITETCVEHQNTKSKKSFNRQQLDQVRKQIEAWKRKLKKARNEHKINRARRFSKKLKECRELLSTEEEKGVGYKSETCLPQFDIGDIGRETSCSVSPNDRVKSTFWPPTDKGESNCQLKKRKKNFCIYCKRLVSRFTEHLEKCHPDTQESIQLKNITGNAAEKRLKKTKITDPLRKLWNSVYNKDKPIDLVIPVKARDFTKKSVGTVICYHCQGYYRRDKLSIHLRNCASFAKSKIEEDNASKVISAVKEHSLPHIHGYILSLVSNEFVEEILKGINLDDVTEQAINEPLIMRFGSEFHQSRREVSSKSYVIREIRDLTRLFIEIKKKHPEINSFEECFNPKYFDSMVESALLMAGYDPKTGSTDVPSIAYRLSQPIKAAAELVKNQRLSNMYKENIYNRSSIEMINDFLDLINTEWKNKIGRICRKSQKLARVGREEKVALQEDIVKFASYIESLYRKTISELKLSEDKKPLYNVLMHLLVSHIMLLVRRRPVDFKSAKLRHYDNIDKHDDLVSMANVKDFDKSDVNVCKQFHIFYVPGKNLQIVPMVLTPLMKKVMDTLIKERSDVGITNDTLFSLADNKNIKPNESLKKIAEKVNLKRPSHMTGNGLRHQAATFSRLHSTHPQYQDYLASVLGHNLFTHKKHYDLPTSIIQKIMVCPVLHNIMTGSKQNNANSKDNKITLTTKQILQSSSKKADTETTFNKGSMETSQNDKTSTAKGNNESPQQMAISNSDDNSDEFYSVNLETTTKKEKKPKKRWSEAEQKIVFEHFGKNVLDKVLPKRKEVVDFYQKYCNVLRDRSVVQLELFIRNHVERKQLNVTPRVKKMFKLKSYNS